MGNIPTSVGNQLQTYARTGDEDAFHAYLQNNATIDLNNRTFKNGNTVLHTAAKNGCASIAAELISNQNMDVNIQNKNGYAPLHLACMAGKIEVVEQLLRLKADKDMAAGVWESTPLHWACICGNVEVIRLLIKKGANTTLRDQTGKLPFDFIRDLVVRAEFTGEDVPVKKESTAQQEEYQRPAGKAAVQKSELAERTSVFKADVEKMKPSAPPVHVEDTEETGSPKEKAPQPAEEQEGDGVEENVPQLPTQVSNSVTKSPKKTMQTFKEGDRIEGKHQGGPRWYPGIIAEVNPDGTYEINYDDGDEESDVIPEHIRFFDGPLPDEESESEGEGSEDDFEDSQVRTIER